MQVFIHGSLHELQIEDPSNTEEIESVIEALEQLQICVGGPAIAEYMNVNPICAYQDFTRKWRHKNCEFVVSKGLICQYCRKLGRTLKQSSLKKL